MDLSSPINSVIPSAHGAVLSVLARTHEPLSGRQVSVLTDGRVGQVRTNEVLGQLSDAGVVLREHRPPAKLYRLNRDHVAASGVIALVGQWEELLQRIRDELASWAQPPMAAALFGSASRGAAGPGSDVDILLVPSPDAPVDEGVWPVQVDLLVERVHTWSGNACEVLVLTADDVQEAVERRDRLVQELRASSIPLACQDVRTLLRERLVR